MPSKTSPMRSATPILYRPVHIFALCLVGSLLDTAFVQPVFAQQCTKEQLEKCPPLCSNLCSGSSDCSQFCTTMCTPDPDSSANATCAISTCGDEAQCRNDEPCEAFCSKKEN